MLHLPPPAALQAQLETLGGAPLSYGHAQGVDVPPAAGFIVDCHQACLGKGLGDFERAAQALRSWVMFPEWARIFPQGQPQEPGRIVAMVTRIIGLWWVNPARILHRIDEVDEKGRRCGMVYGTLAQHAECGEERFQVEMRADGSVWYEICAFSRPRHLLAWLGFPLARWWQLRFVRDSQAAMAQSIAEGREAAG